MVETLKEQEVLPKKMLTDQGYGSDGNFMKCAENKVSLLAPAPPKPAEKIGLDECEFDENQKLVKCPVGNKPMKKEFIHGKGRAVFHKKGCEKCPLKDQCRARKQGKQNYVFSYTDADLRTGKRRKFEATDAFKTFIQGTVESKVYLDA